MSSPPNTLGHVLLTGGCGFLGHHIVKELLQRYPATKISVLDLRTTSNRVSSPNVSYFDGDITDSSSIEQLFSKLKPEIVIHTASPHFNVQSLKLLYKVNVDGTKCLLEAAQKSGVKAFIYTSSASVIYDSNSELINADERWPLITGDDQPEYYTSTKAWAEVAVLEANRGPTNMLTTAIRPAGIFGEGDVQTIPKMIGAYRKGQTKFQVGNNENLFDFTYVKNIAYAHTLAAAALLETHEMLPKVLDANERVDGEAFIITNGSPSYFWDFARVVWRECGDTLPMTSVWKLSKDFAMTIGTVLEWGFWLVGKTPNLTRQQVKYSTMTRYYNIDKAKRRLGYQPVCGLEEGIIRTVKWHLANEQAQAAKPAQ